MGRSMGGGGSRGGGGGMSRGGGGGGSRSGGGGMSRGSGRSSSSHSMGGTRSGTSRAFGSGHSGGSSVRASGRSYSGQTSSGNPMMGGFGGSHRAGGPGGPGYGGPGGPGFGGPGYHQAPPPPPPHYHHHRYYGRRYYDDEHVYVHHTSGLSSALSGIFIIIILLIAFATTRGIYRNNNRMYYNYNAPSYHDSYSKEPRSKFTGTVNLNGFYSDPDGLLYDDEVGTLEDGLEHFYKATGVCAYVYFVEELDENTDGNEYATALYDELFSDEGHILLLYDYTNAYMYDAEGYAIGTTIDSEALDMIYDYIEAEWADDSENLGAIFGDGCAKAADRMMYKEKTFAQKYKAIIIVIIVSIALIIIVSLLFKWWKARTAQKNKEQEDLERTLKTPLESFGSTPMDDLKKKYDDSDTNS